MGLSPVAIEVTGDEEAGEIEAGDSPKLRDSPRLPPVSGLRYRLFLRTSGKSIASSANVAGSGTAVPLVLWLTLKLLNQIA